MADLEISIDINAKGTRKGASDARTAIKSVGDEAVTTGKKVNSVADRDLRGLEKQMQAVQAVSRAMSVGLNLLVAGLASLGVAAIAAAGAIYGLSLGYARLGKEIANAEERTGLSAKTLSSLKFQVEKTGQSFDQLQDGLKSFAKTIGDANNGQKEASAKLLRLGIDAKSAAKDIDGAFRTALKTIIQLPPGVERTTAAMDAFGDSGERLLPFIASFHGDIDDLVKKAEELGVTMSEGNVRASQRFNDALSDLQGRIKGLLMTFGEEYMPIVTEALAATDRYIQNHRDNIKIFAENSSNLLRGLIEIWGDFSASIASTGITFQRTMQIMENIDPLKRAIHELLRYAIARGKASRAPEALAGGEISPEILYGGQGYNGRSFGGGSGGGKVAKAAKAALTPMQELQKRLTEAKAAFDLLFGNPEAQRLSVETAKYNDQKSALEKLLKLRESMHVNEQAAIPATLEGLNKELDSLNAITKAEEARKKLQLEFQKEKRDITTRSYDANVNLGAEGNSLAKQIELGRELTSVEQKQISDAAALLTYRRQLEDHGYKQSDIDILVSITEIEQQHTTELLKQVQIKRDQIEQERQYRDLLGGLNSEYSDLNQQLYEVTTGTQMSRVAVLELTDAYKLLSPAQQEVVKARAADIDGMREAIKAQQDAQKAYDDLYGNIRDSLSVLAEQGFGGFFKNVFRKFQSFLIDMATQWLTSKIFKMFFGGGNGQQAQQNGGLLGGIFGGAGQGGGLNLGSIFGGSSGGGIFNLGGSGGGGNGSIMTLPNGEPAVRVNGGGRSGGLAGTLGAIGGLANMFGGAIGGTAGGFISSIGSGVGIGAQIGSIIPGIGTAIGAVIGGAFGFLSSLFGGDPKRKRDKKEKLPALNQGFTDAFAQLRALIGDVRTLRIDPDGALAKATEIRSQIASGFGIQFESKKYTKQSRELISAKLREADVLIEELRAAADIARAAGARKNRLIPEFAGGVFMSSAFQNFRRMNGMLPGSFTGRDTIPAMLARGEMVLNPAQQNRVRAAAGFDAFQTAGIPGYAGGGVVNTTSQQAAPVTIVLQFDHSIDANGMVSTALKSSSVRKDLKVIIEDQYANDELKLQRRGK